VREELGLDPGNLGSPIGAAVPSFFAFAIGALLPLVPFLLSGGPHAAIASAVVAAVVLAVVGGIVGFLSGTGAVRSSFRMVALASLAGGVTVVVGKLVGATLA
jgi:VIT1/CCC1 family predicted Fe2+/Mn2+ transporter